MTLAHQMHPQDIASRGFPMDTLPFAQVKTRPIAGISPLRHTLDLCSPLPQAALFVGLANDGLPVIVAPACQWCAGLRRGLVLVVLASAAAALKARGYHHRFVFSLGTRHCDRRVFEQTLADTLVWLWRGYQSDGPGANAHGRDAQT